MNRTRRIRPIRRLAAILAGLAGAGLCNCAARPDCPGRAARNRVRARPTAPTKTRITTSHTCHMIRLAAR
jgi:hypothetical protein